MMPPVTQPATQPAAQPQQAQAVGEDEQRAQRFSWETSTTQAGGAAGGGPEATNPPPGTGPAGNVQLGEFGAGGGGPGGFLLGDMQAAGAGGGGRGPCTINVEVWLIQVRPRAR